ncbi:MAG: PSD1 domain-containing protein [Planctomycetes bacterium]|nr:PSD1 domain-containing protein [Planctomycetota bacterium]
MLTLLLPFAFSPQEADVRPVDFERDVRPILASRCIECHGEKKQKAGLRLDRRKEALAGAQFGAEPVIVAGNAAESELFARLITDVDDDRMPATGEPLTDEQVELVRAWLDAGAAWPADPDERDPAIEHWAYRAPVRPAVPEVRADGWVRNPIDAFLAASWERDGRVHAGEAPRERLLRRVSLDLSGVPPTVEELDLFLADDSSDAYERVVERLLASPHYGETLAVGWLDLARYADTNGYEKDDRRNQWRWRDWVIDAFNRDVPYDRFTLEQLAGDLLPDATLEQRVATGFHRNTLINEEGGTDPEEFRAAALVDRVNTTASVWLAATLACAQCHNHKYDPFSTKDYYRLLAYFDRSADTGNARAPELVAPTSEQAERARELAARRDALLARLDAPDPRADADEACWRERARAALPPASSWRVAQPLAWSTRSGVALAREADGSLIALGADGSDVYDLELAPGAGTFDALRLEALQDPRLAGGGPGRTGNGNFVVTEVEVFTRSALAPLASVPVELVASEADHEQSGPGDFRAALAIDGDPRTGWAAGTFERGGGRELVLLLAEPLRCEPDTRLSVRIRQEWPGGGHALGRLRVSVGDGADARLRVLAARASVWRRAGPYAPAAPDLDATAQFDASFPAEAERLGSHGRAAAESYAAWRDAPELVDGVVHPLDGVRGTYYFARTFEGAADAELELAFGSDDGLVAWWNGERVLVDRSPRAAALAQNRVTVRGRFGSNRLLVKVVNYAGADGFAFSFTARAVDALPRELASALRDPEASLGTEARRGSRDHFRRLVDPGGRALFDEAKAVAKELAALEASFPALMVMQERAQPREAHVYTRGDFRNPGERVEPGVPALFAPLAEAPPNRLGLARWLVDPANPLVARVAVNRLWERFFGVGIVPSSDDFGTRGEPPTYPELLDWLATEFVARGWSTKALVRLIVTSAAYRQDSRMTTESFEQDPDNRRFLRGPRGRVEAEEVRDGVLAISGLLVERLGGPSVFPPQPDGIWNLPYNGDQWTPSTGADRYRRGLYTFARRSAPYPTFNTFDAPTRELACTRRPRSNSPLQALTLLNDPAFVEAAGAFARRIVARAADDRERATFAFRACTARAPEPRELAIVLRLLASERERFATDGEAAAKLCAASGLAAEPQSAELAAWIVVANALFNLDETITKS